MYIIWLVVDANVLSSSTLLSHIELVVDAETLARSNDYFCQTDIWIETQAGDESPDERHLSECIVLQ